MLSGEATQRHAVAGAADDHVLEYAHTLASAAESNAAKRPIRLLQHD
jgi:hypothetical protein